MIPSLLQPPWRRASVAAACAVMLLMAASAALAADPPEEIDPFDAASAQYDAAETDAARLAVIRKFMAEHPDHDRIGASIREGVRLLDGPLDDHAGAVALASEQLAAASDPELRREIQEILLGVYGVPAHADDLAALVGSMHDITAMTYTEHLTVLEAAAGAEAWGLVDRHVAAAAELATAEAFRAAYPDRDFSDSYVESAGRNRRGLLRTYVGWSAANRGDTADALAAYREAADLVRSSFLGIPENALYLYWGQTLVRNGDREKGLELLALAGIFGADHDADELARRVYLDMGRDEESYDDYLWELRLAHGVDMVDFQATDYADAQRSFNELRGRKATLLAFWFPT